MDITAKAKLGQINLDTEMPVSCSECGHITPIALGKLTPGFTFVCACGETVLNKEDIPKQIELFLRSQVDSLNKAFGSD
jgi:hypothetical protein